MSKQRLIITGPAGGGTGKTTTAVLLASAARLAGNKVVLVDADVTTRGLLGWLSSKRVHRLPAEPTEAAAFPGALLERSVNAHIVIIDAGAAALHVPAIGPTIVDCARRFGGAGWEVTLLLSVVSGKPGLEQDVARAVEAWRPIASLFAALSMSARLQFTGFAETLADVPQFEVPAVPRLLVRELITSQTPPHDYVKSPPEDRALAAAILAQLMRQMLDSAAARDLLGIVETPGVLTEASARVPKRYSADPANLSDAWLDADSRYFTALADLLDRRLIGDASILAAAHRLIEASASRTALLNQPTICAKSQEFAR